MSIARPQASACHLEGPPAPCVKCPAYQEDLPAASGVGSTAVGGRWLVVCGVVAVGCWSAGESEHCRRLGNVLSARLGVPKSSIPHACDIVQFRHDCHFEASYGLAGATRNNETRFTTSSTAAHHWKGIASSLQRPGTLPGCISRREPPGHVPNQGGSSLDC